MSESSLTPFNSVICHHFLASHFRRSTRLKVHSKTRFGRSFLGVREKIERRTQDPGARTPTQPLIVAITSGIAPNKMNTISPGMRIHSSMCERGKLM